MIRPSGSIGCGCCGRALPAVDALHRVPDGSWRCFDHLARSPCCIEGCGKTYKNDGDYDARFICGPHWRLAPKRWRSKLTLYRRRAAKIGWSDKLIDLYNRAWERCVRVAAEVAAGDLDMAAVNRLFGWDLADG